MVYERLGIKKYGMERKNTVLKKNAEKKKENQADIRKYCRFFI